MVEVDGWRWMEVDGWMEVRSTVAGCPGGLKVGGKGMARSREVEVVDAWEQTERSRGERPGGKSCEWGRVEPFKGRYGKPPIVSRPAT